MVVTPTLFYLAFITMFLDMSDGSHMGGWGGWLGMSIMMVVVWGSILAVGIVLVRSLSDRSNASRPSALDVARERFARGELSDEEFRRIRQDLTR